MISARNNTWDNSYLTNPSHTYPKQIPPSSDELSMTQEALQENWKLRDVPDRLGGESQLIQAP